MDADVLTTPPTAESSSTADAADGSRRSSKVLSPSTADPLWWRSAVIYQIYVRSFADGNGDGTGDLAGVRSRLGYLRDLGVDAIWFTPWYASPLADGGYDVSDYRAIHPDFGTLARGGAAGPGGSGPRHPHHHRRRPEPHLGPAPLVPGGAGRRPRITGARALLVRRLGRDPDPLGVAVRGGDLDPHDQPGRHARPVVPAPVHPRAARPQLEPPRCGEGARGHPQVLVRPRRRRRADRLRRPADQGPGARRGARESRPGRAPDPGSRRAPRRLSRMARGRGLLPRHPRPGRRDLAARDRPLREVPAPRRDAHGVQFRLPRPPVGCPRSCASRSIRPSPRTRRCPRRRPGCSPTTTSPARSPGTAARTPRSRSWPSGSGCPPTWSGAAAAHGRPRC